MSFPRLTIFVSCLLTVAACGGETGTLDVDVCGDVLIPDEVTEARVTVLDAERNEIRSAVVELATCPGPETVELPLTVQFPSPTGKVWIVVQGLRDEVEILRYERRAQLDGGDDAYAVGLTRVCIGISCPLGQTCVNGRCAQASFDESLNLCGTGAEPQEGALPDDPEPLCSDDPTVAP